VVVEQTMDLLLLAMNWMGVAGPSMLVPVD
jgi:hypothetical protein